MKKKYILAQAALLTASLSKAKRLKVGAVLTHKKRIICNSYNGTITKTSNKCEKNNITFPYVLHAEENLIIFCANNKIKLKNRILFLTHSPCINCAKLLVAAKIKKIYYIYDFRDLSGIDFCKKNKIKIEKINI